MVLHTIISEYDIFRTDIEVENISTKNNNSNKLKYSSMDGRPPQCVFSTNPFDFLKTENHLDTTNIYGGK